MRSHLAFALAAAAATAAIGSATARPAYQDDSSASLRAENQELKAELSYYQSAYDELADGLDRIDRAADALRDRKGKQRIQRLVETSRERADQYVAGYERDGWGRDDGYGYYALSDAELARVVSRVQAESYTDDQLALIQEIAQISYFTADQVVTLMKLCTYEDTRIEVAAALYPRVVDSQNWYVVYDGLTYSSSKQTLRKRLGI